MRINLERICVPMDFSDTADHALLYGCTLADQFGATVHLLHVVEDIQSLAGAANEIGVVSIVELIQNLRNDATKRLEAIQPPCDANIVRTVEVGSPMRVICKVAKEQAIDLIIMGTHGRTGISHFILGSVAERVVRSAPCPVLTVRNPEHEFVLPD